MTPADSICSTSVKTFKKTILRFYLKKQNCYWQPCQLSPRCSPLEGSLSQSEQSRSQANPSQARPSRAEQSSAGLTWAINGQRQHDTAPEAPSKVTFLTSVILVKKVVFCITVLTKRRLGGDQRNFPKKLSSRGAWGWVGWLCGRVVSQAEPVWAERSPGGPRQGEAS